MGSTLQIIAFWVTFLPFLTCGIFSDSSPAGVGLIRHSLQQTEL